MKHLIALILATVSLQLMANDIVRETSAFICEIENEKVRFDFFKVTASGSKCYMAARGLDSEGNPRGHCEYLGDCKNINGFMNFIPDAPEGETFKYCIGRHHPVYKIGIALVEAKLLSRATPAGTTGLLHINLAMRNDPTGREHYFAPKNSCVKL